MQLPYMKKNKVAVMDFFISTGRIKDVQLAKQAFEICASSARRKEND